jgi:TPR repeat protein
MWMLGRFYEMGVEVEKDEKKAFKLYSEISIETGYGHFAVGYCHEFGIGTIPDIRTAIQCYTKSSKEKFCQQLGMYALYLCYAYGTGVDYDKKKAEEFRKNSEKNIKPLNEVLIDVEKSM